MKALTLISAMYVGFSSLFGFLFGQLFFGSFSLIDSAVGVTGLFATLGALLVVTSNRAGVLTFFSALASFCAVVSGVIRYYVSLDVPGNYYPWHLVVPFLIALLLIGHSGWQSAKHSRRRQPRTGA
jgi:hypothetical protein